MPSPIAHIGVGYAIYRKYQSSLPEDRRRFWLIPVQMAVVAALSLLPDLDTILAVLLSDMEKYHNNFWHSFVFAFPVALLCAGLLHFIYRSGFGTWFFVCLLSYEVHIIMDFFTAERGVMLLWPFSEARLASPVKLFYGLQWGLGWFSVWHLWTIFTEAVFSGLVILGVIYLAKKKRARSGNP